MNFNNFGLGELLIVLVIVLLIFGPKRLPGIGRSLGQGMREFKDSITGSSRRDDDDEERSTALPAATDAPPPSAAEPPVRTPEAEGTVASDRGA